MTIYEKIKKLFSPIFKYPEDYFWNIFTGLLLTSYSIFSIEITRYILVYVGKGNIEAVYKLIYWFFGISVIFSLSRFFLYGEGWGKIMHNGIDRYISFYLTQYVTADGNSVEKLGTGKILTTLDKGLHDWFDLLFEITLKGVATISFTIYVVYTIFQISFYAGILSVLALILSIVVSTIANIWMSGKRIERRDAYRDAVHNTTILIMSRNETLQNNGLLHSFQTKISYYLQLARAAHERVQLGFLVIEEFPRFMLLLIRIGVYIYISNLILVSQGNFTDFAIFITIIAVGEKGLNEFLHLTRDGLRLFSYIENLWSTFDSLTPIKGYDSGLPFSPQEKNIEIHDITYGYNETKVFENFSLTLEKGKKTALVGASGGGKTTLMKLIAGYLHPGSGSISVMGNTLSETALKTYYPHIGYLTQEPGVFDATIRENLVSAISTSNQRTEDRNQNDIDKNKKTKEHQIRNHSADGLLQTDNSIELERALRLAQCDFVFELEHGLDTEIGERGVRLSGGQKQRLAIAKIFLKNPEIILLDEPTSALDSFSEEKITEALNTLFEGRTVIIVAHRLQTVKRADDIIVIEGGEVVERGNHETLVAKGGIYQKMLELQSGF